MLIYNICLFVFSLGLRFPLQTIVIVQFISLARGKFFYPRKIILLPEKADTIAGRIQSCNKESKGRMLNFNVKNGTRLGGT